MKSQRICLTQSHRQSVRSQHVTTIVFPRLSYGRLLNVSRKESSAFKRAHFRACPIGVVNSGHHRGVATPARFRTSFGSKQGVGNEIFNRKNFQSVAIKTERMPPWVRLSFHRLPSRPEEKLLKAKALKFR